MTQAPHYSAPILIDGQRYDFDYRRAKAMAEVAAARPRPRPGLPVPPGPPRSETLRRLFLNRQDFSRILYSVQARYPRIAYMQTLAGPSYVLTHPDTVLQVFHTHGRDTTKSSVLLAAKIIVGEGLLTSEGDQHLRQRRLIQPGFHTAKLNEYARSMSERANHAADTWSDGQHLDMVASMSAVTLSIVGDALMGSELSDQTDEVGAALTDALSGVMALILPGGKLLAPLRARAVQRVRRGSDRLDELVADVIEEHRANPKDDDILAMMLAAREGGYEMDDATLRDEVMTLILAGHETTAMALSWTWYLLALNPLARARLEAEVDTVLDGRGALVADLPALPYAHACIAESMRLFPPASVIGRRTTVDIDVDEWLIPAGSTVLASQFAMGRDRRFWSEPSRFRPERWLTDEGTFSESAPGISRGAWFPFGFGTRRCIGDRFAWMEAVIVLTTLAGHWRAELDPGARVSPQLAITLRPGQGLPMTVHRR